MEQQETKNNQSKYVLVADVDRIKDFIFASVRLKHIVNASSILTYVNEFKTKEIICNYGGKTVFTAGGVTEAVFDDRAEAELCLTELEKIYPKKTISATVTAHIQEWYKEDNSEDKCFAKTVKLALAEVRKKKDSGSSVSVPFFSGSPFLRICEQTGKEFATKWEHRISNEPFEAFGASSWNANKWHAPEDMKAEIGKCKYESLDNDLNDRLPVDVLLRHRLAHELGNKPENFIYPLEFEEFKGAKPANYIGFMEADGNGFGDMLSELGKKDAGKDDYKEFSNLLSDVTREVYIKAVATVLKDFKFREEGEKKLIPLRTLILGGDDVLAITLPQLVLPLADEFCRRFQQIAKCKKNECSDKIKALDSFTMSAGVVIAHKGFPFLSFQRLAKSLQKSAKRRSWASRDQNDIRLYGSVDYQIITASSAENLKTLRKNDYTQLQNGKTYSLTAKPYLVSPDYNELKDLIDIVKKMKKDEFPRRQIKALNPILRQDEKTSLFDFLKWYSRLPDKNKENIKNLLKNHNMCLQPWKDDKRPGKKDEIYTPLLDAAELYDIL